VGSGVKVGGIGDGVTVDGTGVDVGSGVGAGAHPVPFKNLIPVVYVRNQQFP